MIGAVCLLVVMFTLYSYTVFELVDTLLEEPRLPKRLRIPVGILNTAIALLLTMLSKSTSFFSYLIVGAILLVEFIIFYKDKFERSLFCMLACVLHVMAVRSISVAVFALATHRTFYGVVDDKFLLILSTGVTFLALNICVLIVIRLVPARKIKIVNQHSELIWLMVSWLAVFVIYLLFNSKVYGITYTHPALIVNQIVVPITVLTGLYIVLFFSFKASELLGYKEKSEKLEHVVEKERQYRTVIGKDVLKVIEINFTGNRIVSGFEEYEMLLGDKIHDYTHMVTAAVEKMVYPPDRDMFFPYQSALYILNAFEQGQRDMALDYRRLTQDGHYVWVCMRIALVRDPDSGDVKGFAQVKDIDKEKRQQLELLEKAERDQLTGLYNKVTTEHLITEILKLYNHQEDRHALMLIDIDYFKNVNDQLGHLYGDIVLAQLAEGLRPLFRSDDVVGRIGGDEFFVFIKNYKSGGLVNTKAEEICRLFAKTYVENGVSVSISASIGIALCPLHGTNFDELYKKADIALYINKEKGKNGYVIYDGQTAADYQSLRTEIDIRGYQQKSFKENRLEYVFKLLYEAENSIYAINSVMKLIAENFGFTRAFIYEYSEDGAVAVRTFSCYAGKEDTETEPAQEISLEKIKRIREAIQETGKLFVQEIKELPEEECERLQLKGVNAMLLFGIRNIDRYDGFVRFDDCEKVHMPSAKELDEIGTICSLLSTFLIKHRSHEREKRNYEAAETIIDNMESLTYVIDRDTYEILYENNYVNKITRGSFLGEKCYEVYRGKTAPCDDCPMNGLSGQVSRSTNVIDIQKFNIKAQAAATWIKWTNGKWVCLISSIEINDETGSSI